MVTFDPVPSRVSFPEQEESILGFWKEKDVFRRSIEQRPVDGHLSCVLAHDARAGGQLVCRLASHGKAHKEGTDLLRRGFARKQRLECAFERSLLQRLAPGDRLDGVGKGSVSHRRHR